MNFFTFPKHSKYFFNTPATGGAAGSPGGAAPAVAPAATSTPTPVAPAVTSAPDWTSGLSEDHRGFVGNKGFKNPVDVVDAYRGLEKLLGAPKERLVTLPERFYDDNGKLTAEGRAIRERIGAPKDAKEYDLKAPKEGGDPKLLEHFRSVFHELGIPKADAEKITGSWNQFIEAQTTTQKELAAQALKDQEVQLGKEWGAATEQNTNIAKEAVRTMGFSKDKIDALAAVLGHAETMKFFHKLGTQVREAPFIGGSRQDQILAPEGAKQQIRELINDKAFGKLLEAGDKDARAKWENLHKMAHPGEMRVG